jgi:peroxiredoxin
MGVIKMGKNTIAMLIVSILMLTFSISCAANQATPASSFTLTDMNGHAVSLTDYKGQKAVLLVFFGPRTGGGQDPLLREYLDYYKQSDKLQIIPIVDMSEPGSLVGSGQTRLTDVGYTPLKDVDGSVNKAFGANPNKLTLVLIDRDANIRFRQEVNSTADTNTDLATQIKEFTK